MVPLTSLLLPIVLSAVLVFIASSIIHMLLPYHRKDFAPLPNEDAVRSVLRVPPGDYATPYAASAEAMKTPEFTQKMKEGPVVFMTVLPGGSWNMGATLAQWFVYCLVVSVFAGYVGGRATGPGAEYLSVFRFTSVTAFLGYAAALWQGRIWYRRGLRYTLASTFDGFVYALLTAGVFGWLWPAA
jgi:hypothetical protein